jgi:Flp pilus assembly protein TadB
MVSGPNGREKLQRQFVIFACVAAALVLLLAWSQYQHGTARTIGLVVGLPVIVVLFIVADRFRREIKRP